MPTLIASDVIIQAELGAFDLSAWLISQPHEEFRLAAITVAELWQGAERATGIHRTKRRLLLRRIFETFEIVPYGGPAALEHARLGAELESTVQPIAPYDLMLAAMAIHSGNAVATFNGRQFSPVKGLKVVEPR